MDQSLQKPHFRVPRVESCLDPLSYLANFREAADIATVRAYAFQRQGKDEEALDAALKVVKLGYLLEGAGGISVHYQVGRVIKSCGYNTLRRLLPGIRLEPDRLLHYTDALRSCAPSKKDLRDCLRAEYAFRSGSIDAVAAGKLKIQDLCSGARPATLKEELEMLYNSRYLFKPNQTKRLAAEATRALLADLEDPLADPSRFRVFREEKLNPFTQPDEENRAGRLFIEWEFYPLSSLVRFFPLYDGHYFKVHRTLLAMKAYKMKTGHLPATLEDLVPAYLEEVPLDIDQKPLRYSRDKKVLYSIGMDLEDDGGNEMKENGEWRIEFRNEPTFPIEF